MIKKAIGEIVLPDGLNVDELMKRARALVDEFRPELEKIRGDVDEIEDKMVEHERRISILEDLVKEHIGHFDLTADIFYRTGLDSNLGGGAGTDPDDFDWPEDIFGVHSVRVRVSANISEDVEGAVSYWEDSNNNPFHGRGSNNHGIDEAWVSGKGLGGQWTVGKLYASDARSGYENTVGSVFGTGLTYYVPVATPGVSYERDLGSIDLTLVSFVSAGNDGEFAGRAGIDLGDSARIAGTYVSTGVGFEEAWGIDGEVEIFDRHVVAEFAQVLDNINGQSVNNNENAFVVGVPDLLDGDTLSVGVRYGEVERNYLNYRRSAANNPYLLRASEGPWDSPHLFTPGAGGIADGYEVKVGVNLGNLPLYGLYKDGDDINGNDANAVLGVGLKKSISATTYVDIMYGWQEDAVNLGGGRFDDRNLIRGQIGVGF